MYGTEKIHKYDKKSKHNTSHKIIYYFTLHMTLLGMIYCLSPLQ